MVSFCIWITFVFTDFTGKTCWQLCFCFFKNYGWYDSFVLTAQFVSTGGKEQSFLGK